MQTTTLCPVLVNSQCVLHYITGSILKLYILCDTYPELPQKKHRCIMFWFARYKGTHGTLFYPEVECSTLKIVLRVAVMSFLLSLQWPC